MIPNFEPYLSGAPKGHGVEPPGLDLKVVAELPSGRRMALDLVDDLSGAAPYVHAATLEQE